MKIGIFTIVDNGNYGNRLQNYASQKILSRHSTKVYTIVDENIRIRNLQGMGAVLRQVRGLLFPSYKKAYKRLYNFLDFDEKYITFRQCNFKENFASIINSEFDKFFVGSDQVWNTEFATFNENFLLSFVENQKRYCIAPSIGKSRISSEYIDLFKKELKNFRHLNVREYSAKKTIESILPGKKVDVVLDPTLLLSSKEWDLISDEAYIPKEKYILIYFLESISNEAKRLIMHLSSQYNIIALSGDIHGEKYVPEQCVTLVTPGPAHFIALVKHAEMILTNSFHACVFSLIYNKQFLVFDRSGRYSSMKSRINDFLREFKLEDRKYSHIDQCTDIDYSIANDILKKRRCECMEYFDRLIKE